MAVMTVVFRSHIIRGDAGRDVAARHHLAPLCHVGGRVRIEDRVAGGAARHVHAPVILAARETVRIGVAQLVLGEERQPGPVLGPLDVVGPRVAEPAPPRGIAPAPRERRAHPFELKSRQRLAVERLELRLEHVRALSILVVMRTLLIIGTDKGAFFARSDAARAAWTIEGRSSRAGGSPPSGATATGPSSAS